MSKILFSNEFFNREVRNGFAVGEVMKRFWATHLDVLQNLTDICEKHSLKMFACYGTLLGAVRERGFIPWDDDIDIGLVGEDYISFLDILSGEYADKYDIYNPYTKSWHNMNFSHIVNSRDISFKRSYLNKWNGCPFMTGPDIYPYYYIPRNPTDEQFVLMMLERTDEAIALNKQLTELTENNGSTEMIKRLNETLAVKLVALQSETGFVFDNERPIENQLEILYDQICRVTEEKDADYVARYDEYFINRAKKFPKDYFSNTVKIPFEHIAIPVPIGYDAVLRARFGQNYIIPRNVPSMHDYPCYIKQLSDDDYYSMELSYLKSESTPLKENSVGSDKKVVLYHTGVRDMLIHSESVSGKINRVLDYFEEKSDDIELWWMPDVFIRNDDTALDMVAPTLISEYEEIMERFRDMGGVLCSINTPLSDVVKQCDEYYGDDGVIAEAFRNNAKTVTIQDYSSARIEFDEEYSIEKDNKDNFNKDDLNKEKQREIPAEWKRVIINSDGSQKKVMLYVTSISIMYQYKSIIVDKLSNVLNTFKSNSDKIALIWRPVGYGADLKEVFDEDFMHKYLDIVENYRNAGWGILDETDSSDAAVGLADAAYGDADFVLKQCYKKGIPVMIENVDIQ